MPWFLVVMQVAKVALNSVFGFSCALLCLVFLGGEVGLSSRSALIKRFFFSQSVKTEGGVEESRLTVWI